MEDNCINKTVQEDVETSVEKNDTVEVVIDEDFLCISRTRYEALIRTEVTLEMVHRVLAVMDKYDAYDALRVILGFKKSREDED